VRIGDKLVGFAPHHFGGGCSDLMAFARIETCSTGVADVFCRNHGSSSMPEGVQR
jgi:hypothetical protein